MNCYFLNSVISVWGGHCDYLHSVQKDLAWTGWSSVAENLLLHRNQGLVLHWSWVWSITMIMHFSLVWRLRMSWATYILSCTTTLYLPWYWRYNVWHVGTSGVKTNYIPVMESQIAATVMVSSTYSSAIRCYDKVLWSQQKWRA